jgi:hypothetical protein
VKKVKERLFLILSLGLIVAALVGLNAASYAPNLRESDREEVANRSTYNGGASGTRAFYEFLSESGKPVVRWQQKPFALLDEYEKIKPKIFVILDNPRRQYEEKETRDLLNWTASGNRLVIISRRPEPKLLPQVGNWRIEIPRSAIFPEGDSSNVAEMTQTTAAARPVQPDLLLDGVNAVMPSRFASAINLHFETPSAQKSAVVTKSPSQIDEYKDNEENETSQTDKYQDMQPSTEIEKTVSPAPVVLLANKDRSILAQYVYGAGQIVVLSDSFIVSNAGLGLVDNLRLATNIVDGGGLIAFDEYHQGFGASGNSLLFFFENTPLPAIFAQICLILLFAVYTQGRRFARPVPLPVVDRRSKLEYVSAMAELQRQTRAFDLAIENIYARARRNLARFAGADNLKTSATDLAQRVAERSRIDKNELEKLLRDCENAIQGEPLREKEALKLAAKLRQIEQELGFEPNTQSSIK